MMSTADHIIDEMGIMENQKKHIARPMDAYRKNKELICMKDPDTRFRCEAVMIDGYRSTAEIIREFERIGVPNINSTEETF
jgi:hypothetical protein